MIRAISIAAVLGEHVEPLLAQIRANLRPSRTLATLCDMQRPMLLSGELSLARDNFPALPDRTNRKEMKP